MRRLLFALVICSVAAIGCNGDDTQNGNNIISNISTPTMDAGNSGETDAGGETDMGGETDTGGNNETDMGSSDLCDQNVDNPGFLNGTWNIVIAGTPTFELRYCHDLNNTEQPIQGTFTELDTGLTGDITNTTYQADPFALTINWFVRDGDNQYQFGVSQGQRVDENRVTARFLDGRLMEPSGAELIRQ